MQTELIGSSLKGLAKTYIALADINTVKNDNIAKMRSMGNREFRRRYARFYEILKDMPTNFKDTYGLNEYMNRTQFMSTIRLWDKDKIYQLADNVPNEVIVKQLNGYLQRRKQDIKNGKIAEQVKRFWRRIRYYIEEDD